MTGRVVVGACQNGTILETLPELSLVTQMLVPSNATPRGFEPTVTVAVTVLVAGTIFDTLFEGSLRETAIDTTV